MNPAKAYGKLQLNLDMAGLAHVFQVYTAGLPQLILTDQGCVQAQQFMDLAERHLIGSGYLTEGEVKAMRVTPKRFITMDMAKLPE